MRIQSSTPSGVFAALVWHARRLLSFQHDGRGLPSFGSSMLLVLLGAQISLGALSVHVLYPDLDGGVMFIKSLVMIFFLYLSARFTRQPSSFSAYLILWVAMDIFLLSVSLFAEVPRAFASVIYFWGLLAYLGMLLRATRVKNNNSNGYQKK